MVRQWTTLQAMKSDYDTALLRVEAATELLDEVTAEREHLRSHLVGAILAEIRRGATWTEIGAQVGERAEVAEALFMTWRT